MRHTCDIRATAQRCEMVCNRELLSAAGHAAASSRHKRDAERKSNAILHLEPPITLNFSHLLDPEQL